MIYIFFVLSVCSSKYFHRIKAKGDPSGFNLFMKNKGIKPKVFLRYVGNRFHVIFHMAGVVLKYQAELREYLQK